MSDHKVVSEEDVRAWRAGRESVVFTNGVFDILHPGHVDLIERAKSMGKWLVVGLNSDASAAKLEKGPGRPINDQQARARVLAALEAVDCIVLFDEATPARLIERIAPDVLVKGGDYRVEDIPGREAVEARGGKVVTVPYLEGYSTTAMVERIREQTRR